MTTQHQNADRQTTSALVTGSTGIVGIHLLKALASAGYKVRALRRETSRVDVAKQVFDYYGCSELFGSIEWVTGDVLDTESLAAAMTGIDIVFHTAAIVSFYAPDHEQMWRINVEGTANVCSGAIKAGARMCHVSSIATIGNTVDGSPRTEETPWQPEKYHSVYSLSKFRQEMEVWRAMESGLKAVVVAPGVVLGPGQTGRSTSAIAETMKHGTSFFTYGKTGYVDARDLAEIMIGLCEAEKWGEKYIVVSHNSTVRTIQDMFADAFGKPKTQHAAKPWLLHTAAELCRWAAFWTRRKPALTHESVRAMCGADNEADFSSAKAMSAMPYEFTPLKDTIESMAQYYITQ